LKVLVYVEGPSDRSALEALLVSVIEEARDRGVGIRFLHLGGKAQVLRQSPLKAASHLAEHPADWVFALPDLYPMAAYDHTDERHQSPGDLDGLLTKRFEGHSARFGVGAGARQHFRVHCLKYDLEALLLAAPDGLRKRLRTKDSLSKVWRKPVEDQNDGHPPKRIIEDLFKKYGDKRGYTDTIDAPWILEQASLEEVVAGCQQCFAPFVDELKKIAAGEALPDR
jgi:hypothetical protein